MDRGSSRGGGSLVSEMFWSDATSDAICLWGCKNMGLDKYVRNIHA